MWAEESESWHKPIPYKDLESVFANQLSMHCSISLPIQWALSALHINQYLTKIEGTFTYKLSTINNKTYSYISMAFCVSATLSSLPSRVSVASLIIKSICLSLPEVKVGVNTLRMLFHSDPVRAISILSKGGGKVKPTSYKEYNCFICYKKYISNINIHFYYFAWVNYSNFEFFLQKLFNLRFPALLFLSNRYF